MILIPVGGDALSQEIATTRAIRATNGKWHNQGNWNNFRAADGNPWSVTRQWQQLSW